MTVNKNTIYAIAGISLCVLMFVGVVRCISLISTDAVPYFLFALIVLLFVIIYAISIIVKRMKDDLESANREITKIKEELWRIRLGK